MINSGEAILKDILLNSSPVLFLGAGFSAGSANEVGVIPTGEQLRGLIFREFVCGNVSPEDEKEIENYSLQELIQYVYEGLEKSAELQALIINLFKNAIPKEFHLLLNAYEWRRIYSVNVDDLVENIYQQNKIPLVVQNQNYEKRVDTETELIKLHGCVRNPEEGFVFSRNEYTQATLSGNYRFCRLSEDIVSKNMIFVGASLDERDVDHYVLQYENAGSLRKGRMIIIDPHPSVRLRTRVKTMDGILIEWTTERFLTFVSKLNYNPKEVERKKKALNYAGFFVYRDIIASYSPDCVYESRLYEGFACRWRDIADGWVFRSTEIERIEDACVKAEKMNLPCFCIAIYGGRFSGKDCALKAMGGFMHKRGFEIIEYRGRSFSIKVLRDYILSNSHTKFVLLMQDAGFYYREIEKLFQQDWKNNTVIVISTSRTYSHLTKRYYLEGNSFFEIEIKDKLNAGNAAIIYDKLLEKGYTAYLSRDRSKAIREILKYGSYINLFSALTYGRGFNRKIKSSSDQIIAAPALIKKLYIELIIFDKADLAYYPSELFVQRYSIDYSALCGRTRQNLKPDQRLIVDYIRTEENGLVLKNKILAEAIWNRIGTAEVFAAIRDILEGISPYISEKRNNYWRIIFESLLKEDILENSFKLPVDEILNLYYGLRNNFSNISYYWLQLGIAEQKKNEYAKALNHLQMAHQIRPSSYQIQHAIARNYLKKANSEKNKAVALEQFREGETKMLELINSTELNKEKARNFSVHCYIHEKIVFLRKYSELVGKDECRLMKRYLDMVIDKEESHIKNLVGEFMSFLRDYDMLDSITMNPNDMFFDALSSKYDADADDMDVLINSV